MTILHRAPSVAVPLVGRSPRHDDELGYEDDETEAPRPLPTIKGECKDCGDPLISGQEARDGLCWICVRARAGA